MNPSPEDSARTFADRVRRARADRPAPIDTAALLRALRQAPVETRWWNECAALLASRSVVAACSAGALAAFTGAGWLAWDIWQHVLPWAQLFADIPLSS